MAVPQIDVGMVNHRIRVRGGRLSGRAQRPGTGDDDGRMAAKHVRVGSVGMLRDPAAGLGRTRHRRSDPVVAGYAWTMTGIA